MKIIDCHAHLWIEEFFQRHFWVGLAELFALRMNSLGQKISQEEVLEELFPRFWDPTGEKLIKEMEEAGIDHTVLMVTDFGLCLGDSRISVEEQNEHVASVARKFPDRLSAFVGVDPRRNNALDMVVRGIRDWGMKGVKIYPPAGFYPNEAIVYPIYQKAQELGVPVLSHTGAITTPFRSKFAQPVFFDDVTVDFPKLKIIMAHMGFGWWEEASMLVVRHQNLFGDICGWLTYAKANHKVFCEHLRYMMDLVGPKKLMFGTDGPVVRVINPEANKEWVQVLKNLPKNSHGIRFSQEEVDGLLGNNAIFILNMEL